jgi:outer membrane protein assembly factor BamB
MMRTVLIILYISIATTTFSQESKWRYTMNDANVFSSPRFADLNRDGVKDVIIGGGVESSASENGIVAIDGNSGEVLWNIPSRTQIYTSALFQDITGDSIVDVFIGGRAASYFAINGATGEIIWQFFEGSDSESRAAGFLNFFGTQFIKDQDEDGLKDLLVTNGGDYLAAPENRDRATARLMVLSSASGKILHSALMPEDRESYYAPHTVKFKKNKCSIIFGTGGETVDGSLWRVPLKSLLKGNTRKAKQMIKDSTKGFILNSVVSDINGDDVPDIMNARMDATLSAIDGKSNKLLWNHEFGSNKECYVTPSLGRFVGDETPDFFTIIATGTFPRYESFELIVIDGATGEIAWSEVAGINQFSPCSSADINNDGNDEIIFVQNEIVNPKTYEMINKLRVIDLKNDTSFFVEPSRPGLSMASAPGIIDLDNNGNFEIVVATSSIAMGDSPQYSIVECLELNQSVDPTWPGYLGPNENGNWNK